MRAFIVFLIFLSTESFAKKVVSNNALDRKDGLFTGRVARINKEVGLMRVRVDFENMKFLNSGDSLEFWYEEKPEGRCRGFLEGKSNRYYLIKINDYANCVHDIALSTGSLLFFHASALANNIKIAKELIDILLKKRLALISKKEKHHKELARFIERVEALNERYIALREKLELEWEKELSKIEEDKATTIKSYREVERNLDNVESKIKQYRVNDKNLKVDRWSLDPNLYQKK